MNSVGFDENTGRRAWSCKPSVKSFASKIEQEQRILRQPRVRPQVPRCFPFFEFHLKFQQTPRMKALHNVEQRRVINFNEHPVSPGRPLPSRLLPA